MYMYSLLYVVLLLLLQGVLYYSTYVVPASALLSRHPTRARVGAEPPRLVGIDGGLLGY